MRQPVHNVADLLARVAARTGAVRVTGLRGSARAWAGAQLVREHSPEETPRVALFVAPDAKSADALAEDLRVLLGEPLPEEGGRVHPFPRPDTLPFDRFSPQPFVVAQRMDVLHRLATAAREQEHLVVVAPITALALRVPSRDALAAHTIALAIGQWIDREALVASLVANGYARMPIVEERGELAVRGGIVDVFPPHRARPVRIELLGDEIESIREFDAASQRSQERVGAVALPPPREILLDRDLVIERSAAIRAASEAQGADARATDETLDTLLRGALPPGAEALAPWLQPSVESFFDYLPGDALVVVEEPEEAAERLARFDAEVAVGAEAARGAGRVAAPAAELLLSAGEVERALAARRPVALERLDVESDEGGERIPVRSADHDELRRALARARAGDAALLPLVEQLERWLAERWRIVVAAPALSGAERLRHMLVEYGLDARVARDARPVARWGHPGRIEVRVAAVSEGFALPLAKLTVVTEEEIFGPRERRRTKVSVREAAALESLAQLETGDHLVHAEHGIGVYRGLVLLAVGPRGATTQNEFLRIEYDGGDRLFVPVHRLSQVQRYVGAEGVPPRLDKLGGATWEKAKARVKHALRDMAKELVAVHAARELAPGFAFSPRDRALEEFEATFPYEETPDQLAAIEDVLADMHREEPMDRLVCGDVGFGKTEVSVRAAFKAVMDGKQVAVLVPTTVLCAQHEETFRKRFEGHPIRVESLSRFRTPKEAKQVVEGLKTGAVDVVVGTHRLLQKDIEFRDLGLLVIDEEQRFGVAHKERIKKLKKTVDVLTLTATPIPRTLQMAMTGLRDLSVIHTPPADRLAIRTQLARFSESLLREAILRELQRGGQVFVIHNRVHSIGELAELLAKVVPEARVLVAHGQMPERDLEDRMLRFLHGEADVLLCTSIVESGLDIPRANTMLIDRADTFGLAQLYQLRGRIGRSSHRAYCYLLIRGSERHLTDEARKRLEALQSFTELGSGMRLASMDLEIRGAGNLLGAEQHGNLAEVGFETYMEMLEETIEELRGQTRTKEIDPEIRLPIAAKLPEDYVPDVSQRLVLYKRLASAPDQADADRIRDELLDRFGPLPDEAANLLGVIRLKIEARRLGVAAVDVAKDDLVFTAAETTRIDPKRLVTLLTHPTLGIRVAPNQKIYAPLPKDREPERIFDAAHQLLAQLAA
ncbi:MAG: transcription-repair coupling factor [Proteobacteria bacterium]|nr:MAG: transcription-repair coupling factor [Pseudomonadota bacterium]